MTKEFTAMFVDIVDSTKLKYMYGEDNGVYVSNMIIEFYKVLKKNIKNALIKFTGDGAMLIFLNENKCEDAIVSAEKIIQRIDCFNLDYQFPRINIRIGIATGKGQELDVIHSDYIGKVVDLANRLCSEAAVNEILIDEMTKNESNISENNFKLCHHRLMLKGIPSSNDNFYYYKPNRFVKSIPENLFSKGLLKLYTDRITLAKEFSPIHILELVKPESTIFLSGRTLISWIAKDVLLKKVIKDKQLKLNILLCTLKSCKFLDEKQQEEMRRDFPKAHNYFIELKKMYPSIDYRQIDSIPLNGLCFIEIQDDIIINKSKTIAIQDVNAAASKDKITLLWICTCKANPPTFCVVHNLYDNMIRVFNNADKL